MQEHASHAAPHRTVSWCFTGAVLEAGWLHQHLDGMLALGGRQGAEQFRLLPDLGGTSGAW